MKTTKRILSLILSVIMILSVGSVFAAAEETDTNVVLTDITPTTVVGKAVQRLVSMGIINGYPDGTYRPDNTITRAEFAVIMVRFSGLAELINPDDMTGFDDLDTDKNYEWARPYVAMAVKHNIINGFGDNTFRAAEPVTYEQAVKMIVCAIGYGDYASKPTIEGDWSSGYIEQAMRLRVTSNTTSHIGTKAKPTTRGVAAILVSNALDVEQEDVKTESGDVILPGFEQTEGLGYKEIKGIVTGTYITELEDADSSVPRNHIMIDDEYYEIGFSTDPNDFLGCKVEAVIDKNNEDGDYPIVTSLSVVKKSDVIEIDAEFVGDFDGETLSYRKDSDDDWREVKLDEDYITIFNNKYYDYDLDDLKDDLVTGSVVLVENSGDSKIDVVRINKYDVFVVDKKTPSTQKISFKYDAKYEGEDFLILPSESTALVFSLTRNGKEIKFNNIAEWDVLNLKESPKDADGRRYYELNVTSDAVSGIIDEINEEDGMILTIGKDDYPVAESFLKYEGTDKPEFEVGESVRISLDATGKVVAAAKSDKDVASEAYAYLYALRQDSDDSEYDLEFKLYTTKGKFIQLGSADKITIDDKRYKALNDDILNYLENSAVAANANYAGAENVRYHQPIIYQTNSAGLISTIYTVLSEDNEDISAVMNDGGYFAPCDDRVYKSSSYSFTDFKVSRNTAIIYVPDDRTDSDEYRVFSYSKAFYNNKPYFVEAYGLTGSSSKTAGLVLMFSENDEIFYTSNTPFMIVASTANKSEGTVLTGYVNRKTTTSEVKFAEDGPSGTDIGKGDIIRYITDSSGKIIDYKIWYDASDPVQLEPCDTLTEAIETRIFGINKEGVEGKTDNATFRLQYGTVVDLILNEDGGSNLDDETIAVSPVIFEDNMEMQIDCDGVVYRTIPKSIPVFYYDRTGRKSEVITNADLSEIVVYDADYPEDATKVITCSAGTTLQMIYIVID